MKGFVKIFGYIAGFLAGFAIVDQIRFQGYVAKSLLELLKMLR